MKTVFVLVDALKSLYLTEDNMPFLYELSTSSYFIQNIIPCAGFCERSEIFTGLDGYDTGNFTAIGYMPEDSPYKRDGSIINFFQFVDLLNKRVSNRFFSRWRIKNSKELKKYRIPFKSLSSFSLTEDGVRKFTRHNDIFDQLDKCGKSYTLDAFTSLADITPRLRIPLRDFATLEIDKDTYFIPLYIGIIDAMGHKYGADIISLRPYLQEVDNLLKELYEHAQKKGYDFAVMGDHGMVPVTQKVDVLSIVAKSPYRHGRDYEVFFDSTMVRFWFFNKDTEVGMRDLIKRNLSNDGFIVDQSNYTKFRIPLDIYSATGKPVYGDLVWCANPGVLVSPDYFHSSKESENGMHGYIEVVEGHSTGLFVANSSVIKKNHLSEDHSSAVCGILSAMLEIESPNSNQWSRKII